MDELKFVMKCLVFATLFMLISQMQIGKKTLEVHVESALVNTNMANFLNESAAGGVKLIHRTGETVKAAYNKWKTSGAEKQPDTVDQADTALNQ